MLLSAAIWAEKAVLPVLQRRQRNQRLQAVFALVVSACSLLRSARHSPARPDLARFDAVMKGVEAPEENNRWFRSIFCRKCSAGPAQLRKAASFDGGGEIMAGGPAAVAGGDVDMAGLAEIDEPRTPDGSQPHRFV